MGDDVTELVSVAEPVFAEEANVRPPGEIATGVDSARQAATATSEATPSADELKDSIIEILESQGYIVKSGLIGLIDEAEKQRQHVHYPKSSTDRGAICLVDL